MSPMKKCKVKKMPNGRPEVEVGVQCRRSDIARAGHAVYRVKRLTEHHGIDILSFS